MITQTKMRLVRKLTNGPKFHWFAYYDKLQFDPSQRYLLGMEVDFTGRSPKFDDVVKIGMIDLHDSDLWIPLGESCAWCWQQGCMLQWIPGSNGEIIWNDRRGDNFVSHILDVHTGEKRTIPSAIYALSNDGRTAVTTDFRRINDTRPGYGYTGIADPNRDVNAPDNAGIWRVDLKTGKSELIISIAQVASLLWPGGDILQAKHWFNHLLVSPDGGRFIFLHRWRNPGQAMWQTRMLTAALDGSDMRVVSDSGFFSHFIWRDDSHILAFAKPDADTSAAFYLFDDCGAAPELVMDFPDDGHCTYLPGNEWILCDTYPHGDLLEQNLYIYNVTQGRRVNLGHFAHMKNYEVEWRCDLHPRFSPDGKKVVIDSTHGGDGRQMYMLDVSGCL